MSRRFTPTESNVPSEPLRRIGRSNAPTTYGRMVIPWLREHTADVRVHAVS
uniref:Uncharacterized protein n=1 Tax=uncultured marine group II/III euryarchaeote AD1000_04_H03 TaxID=1457707 RepID=A0A075FLM2_9EURY|nr:hypothetical protein [uncultured marine group II/III euryarchaeote AD1000_04_H03]